MSQPSTDSPGLSWLLWPVILIATVFGGAVVVQSPKTASEVKPATTPAPSSVQSVEVVSDPGPDHNLFLIRDYFKYDKAAEPKPILDVRLHGSIDSQGVRLSIDLGGIRKRSPLILPTQSGTFRFESLIASVPDPADSKFAYEFDSTVVALQWAFQARNYILQSSWLPWRRGPDGKPAGDLHRRYPGMLLFRRVYDGTDEQAFCLVCLVGENPISGAHKVALTRALDTIEEFRHDTAPTCACWPELEQPLPIVGPFYSGSAVSFRDTLRAWKKTPKELGQRGATVFKFVSGSATSSKLPKILAIDGWSFQATVVPTELVTSAILDFMAQGDATTIHPLPSAGASDRDGQASSALASLGRVAILEESNTPFGVQTAIGNDPFQKVKKDDPFRAQGAIRPGPLSQVIQLPFPVSISQLKVDLDKLTTGAPTPIPSAPPDFVAPRLPVRDEPQSDGIALQDRDSTVVVAAEAIRNILATIDREGVQVVGINATDDRDVVFLNRLLKKYCPYVRVFTTGSSVIMSLPSESSHMRGLVVGSTYPLYPPNQGWTHAPENRRLAFASQTDQGVYNAVLAQFGEFNRMIEYRAPDFGGPKSKVVRPPIWVSVVGQNGDLIPVRIYRKYDNSADSPEVGFVLGVVPRAEATPTPARLDAPPSRAFLLDLAVGVVITVWVTASVYSGSRQARYLLESTRPLVSGPDVVARLTIWLAGGMLVSVVLPVFAASSFDLHPRWELARFASIFIFRMVDIILIGLLIRGWFASQFACMTAVVLVGGWALSVDWVSRWVFCDWDRERQFLWLARASDLSSGLSPILPLLLLAATLIVISRARLRESAVYRSAHIKSPFPEDSVTKRFSPLTKQDHRLRKMCNHWNWVRLAWRRPRTYAILLPFLLLAGWFYNRFHNTAEGPVWETVIQIGFALAGMLIAINLVRLITRWSEIRHLLHRVADLPMAAAFEALPDHVSRMFHGHLYPRHPHAYKHVLAQQRALVPAHVFGNNTKLDDIGQASLYLRHLSDAIWTSRSANRSFGRNDPTSKDNPTPPILAEEEYAATVIVVYLSQFLIPLRPLVNSLTVGAPLLLLAAASYPFQPERPMLYALMTLLGTVVAGILFVLYGLNKNELVSRITKTTPNQFNLDRGFMTSVGQYVLPVVGVAVAYLLGVFRVVLEPVLGALR